MNTKIKSLLTAVVVTATNFGIYASQIYETPIVKVDSVDCGDPWSTITVGYTLNKVDADIAYKVAFDVTANGVTKGTTNEYAAAALEKGKAYSQVIDTAALFGAATPDTQAKVKVSLIAIKPKEIPAGQLWENGPIWAECNLGADKPEGYGNLYKFDDAAAAVTTAMGAGWRVPSQEELAMLAGKNTDYPVCSNVWTTCNGVAGCRFFGMTSGYEDKSIFLPAAGWNIGKGLQYDGKDGYYWSSSVRRTGKAWFLFFNKDGTSLNGNDSTFGLSVRAVRDTK